MSEVDAPAEGLCATCVHVERIKHPKGGRAYVMCGLSKTVPSYRRYPVLPVYDCDGYTKSGSEGHPND